MPRQMDIEHDGFKQSHESNREESKQQHCKLCWNTVLRRRGILYDSAFEYGVMLGRKVDSDLQLVRFIVIF